MAAALNHQLNHPTKVEAMPPDKSSMPVVNDNFWSRRTGFRYELISVINEGGFGIVFHANCLTRNNKFAVALKVEKWDKSMQYVEVAVLKSARVHGCRHFPELIDYGSVLERFHFMALTLLGKDLYRLRKEQPKTKFSLSTAVRIGYQTMQAIEEIHTKCRYICRDIKPSNFVIGITEKGTRRRIYMVDFGLCRRYVDQNENVIPSRGEIGWRGTSRYGSLQCHLKMDLGRKDDLESWFYMLVEATTGGLPWQCEKVREIVQTSKITARTSGRQGFLANCPSQFEKLMNKIDSMVFAEEPDYTFFYSILKEICNEHGIKKSDPYDWEPAEAARKAIADDTKEESEEPARSTNEVQLARSEEKEDASSLI